MAATQIRGAQVGDSSLTQVDLDLSGAATKATPVSGDSVIIVDSTAPTTPKRALVSALLSGTAPLRPATTKTSLVDADETTGNDSAATYGQIKTTWANVKAFLKTYFDTLYKATDYKGWYDSEVVTSPTSGTLTLKNATETFLNGNLTNANTFTVALPTPVTGRVNESILIFKIGATLPTITQPSGIIWRGVTPTLAINTNWTIVYEKINTTGSTFEIWASAIKNV